MSSHHRARHAAPGRMAALAGKVAVGVIGAPIALLAVAGPASADEPPMDSTSVADEESLDGVEQEDAAIEDDAVEQEAVEQEADEDGVEQEAVEEEGAGHYVQINGGEGGYGVEGVLSEAAVPDFYYDDATAALPAAPALPGADALPALPGADALPALPGPDGLPGLPALPGTDALPALPGADALPAAPALPVFAFEVGLDDVPSADALPSADDAFSATDLVAGLG